MSAPQHNKPIANKDYLISNDIIVQNFYPTADSISIIDANNDWNITVWRDEDLEVHILVADNQSGTQMNLILGQDGYTQKC